MIILTIQPTDDIQNYLDILDDNGGGILNFNPTDTFNVSNNITLYDNVTINGNGATIDFGGGVYKVSAQGSDAYSTGTLAVNFGSGSVTGTGTTWTSAMVGRSILIGDYWYEITARASNTAITISPVFMAPNVSGVSYVIASTLDNIAIKNISLTNSSTYLLDFRYVNGLVIDSLTAYSASQGINGFDSANIQWVNSVIDDCTTGMVLNNVPFCTLNNWSITNITGGAGLELTGISNTSLGIASIQAITGVGMKLTNCFNLGMVNYSIIECTSHGIEFVSGNSDMDMNLGYINTCGGDGVKLTATSNSITLTSNSIQDCTGYGINIANANCENNILISDTTGNNTAGALNDLGTGTLKSALVNNFS